MLELIFHLFHFRVFLVLIIFRLTVYLNLLEFFIFIFGQKTSRILVSEFFNVNSSLLNGTTNKKNGLLIDVWLEKQILNKITCTYILILYLKYDIYMYMYIILLCYNI